MKIFHLITSIDKGGAETHLYSLIKKQVENRNTIFVIYLKGNGYWKKYLNKIGVRVYKINFENKFNILNFFKVFFCIEKLIIKHNPKVVHAHLTLMELFGAFLKFKLKDKFFFIITKHLDSFFLEASFGRKKFLKGIIIDKFIINQSSKVICISKQVKNYFKSKIPYSKKYSVIYYGFSSKEFKSSPDIKNKINILKNKFRIQDNDIILTNIARHVKQKSLDVLLKAHAIYLKKKKNTKLILVGKGPETKYLHNLALKLNTNQNIIWIDNYENIKDIFLLSDIFVLPSDYEGLGLVLLEAMSSKVPIIASNTSAIPEIIKNNKNGLLFKCGDYRRLVQKFEQLESNSLKKKLIENGNKFLKKNFNLNNMNSRTYDIYNSLK